MIVLSRGHIGTGTKPSATWAPAIGPAYVEDMIAAYYMMNAERMLRGDGIDVVSMSGFPYAVQHRRAAELRASVFVSCHVNAGGHDYGAAFYREGDAAGRAVAEAVAAELRKLPELSRAIARAVPRDGEPWERNVYSTIADAPDGAICYEPGFIDNPAHRSLWDGGAVRVGYALARGIIHALR